MPPFPRGVSPEHVYRIDRMEFDPKYLIATAAFSDRICAEVTQPRWLFVGRRRLGQYCVIRRVSRVAGFKALVRQMVVGVGLYQGLEFLLRASVLDLLRGAGTFVGRFWAAIRLLMRTRVVVAELGRNPARNLERVIEFFDTQGLGHRA